MPDEGSFYSVLVMDLIL